jgi:hypothetical protein
MAEDWQTYFFEAHYPYDDGGTRADCVIAPDRDTARRLAAVQTLEDNNDTLHSQAAETLLDYYDDAPFSYTGMMEIMSEWGDLDGTACPNCTAHCGRPNGNHVELDGATREVLECSSCDYQWLALGHNPEKRAAAIEATKKEIAQLDGYERMSACDPDLRITLRSSYADIYVKREDGSILFIDYESMGGSNEWDDVDRFDPDTLPDEEETDVLLVAFWNKEGKRFEPEQNFPPQEHGIDA